MGRALRHLNTKLETYIRDTPALLLTDPFWTTEQICACSRSHAWIALHYEVATVAFNLLRGTGSPHASLTELLPAHRALRVPHRCTYILLYMRHDFFLLTCPQWRPERWRRIRGISMPIGSVSQSTSRPRRQVITQTRPQWSAQAIRWHCTALRWSGTLSITSR